MAEIKIDQITADCLIQHINAFYFQYKYDLAADFNWSCLDCPHSEEEGCIFHWREKIQPFSEKAVNRLIGMRIHPRLREILHNFDMGNSDHDRTRIPLTRILDEANLTADMEPAQALSLPHHQKHGSVQKNNDTQNTPPFVDISAW